MGNTNLQMPFATSRIAALILLLSNRRVVCCVGDRYVLRNVGDIIKIVVSFVFTAIIFVAVLFWVEPDFGYQPGRATFTDTFRVKGKGKPVPLQARSGPEGSTKLSFPDFMTTAQDGGMVCQP